MKSKWIEHKGKRIFYVDYTDFGMDASALEAEVKEVIGVMRAQPKDSMLVVVDLRGTVASKQAMQVFKSSSVEGQPFVRKSVIVGITGYKKVLLDVVSRFAGYAFEAINDLEKAKDRVVEVG